MKLYHGSQVRDFVPTFGLGGVANDYGRGFYTTADKELGKEWAVGQQANADGWIYWRRQDMKHPYDEVYLNDLIEEQGKFFENLQEAKEPLDSADLLTAYMHSDTRRQMDEGHAWYLTLDADRMKEVFFQESGYHPKAGEPLCGFMPKWIGEFYAAAQWYWNVPSAELCDKLPIDSLRVVYPGAHDLDLMVSVEKLGRPALSVGSER